MTEIDIFAEARKQLDLDPVAGMLDTIAGRVLEAADAVDARIGPLDERQYAAVVAILADRAVMQMAMSAKRRTTVAEIVEDFAGECAVNCTCIYCIPGA